MFYSLLRIAKAEYAKSEYRQLDIIANFRLELENVVRQIESLSNKINADLKSVELAKKGQEDPDSFRDSPRLPKVSRPDEARAARQPILRWKRKINIDIPEKVKLSLENGSDHIFSRS